MINLAPELTEKAKTAKSAEELLALAKENGMEYTEEGIKAFYAQLNPTFGELDDDELDNVAGGGCQSGGQTVVTSGTKCFNGNYDYVYIAMDDSRYSQISKAWFAMSESGCCGRCKNLHINSNYVGICKKS